VGRRGPELLDPACVLMSEGKRKPYRQIAAGLGHLQDVQVGVAGSRAPDLHQDLTRPGLCNRDLTEFARLLPGHQLKRFQSCTSWGRIWSRSMNKCRGPRNTWLIRYGGGSSSSRGFSTRRRNASNAVLTSRRASGPPKQT
jgi:hypothetical protein